MENEQIKISVKNQAEKYLIMIIKLPLMIKGWNLFQVNLTYNIRKDNSKPNEFTREFKALKSNEKYTIYTDDLKFKINFGHKT